MKKYLSFLVLTCLLVLAMTITSCQKEEQPDPNPEQKAESLSANSEGARLLMNTVSNDGSFDNIVDRASCFSVQFPYTVEVSGLEITIDSREDLQLIENVLDAVEEDENLVNIAFPITITLHDYTEVTVNSFEELRKLAEECIEGGNDDDIECIDIVYPVTFFTLDTALVKTGSVVVESDKEMRRFFAGMGENDLISVKFPVIFEMYDGTEVRVSNNGELAAALKNAKNVCDEDDDHDYNDDDFTQERLESLLVKCPWAINEVKRDDVEHTEQYIDYVMNFNADGSVVVRDRSGYAIEGTWSTRVAEHRVLLKMEFEDLIDFNVDWYVYEISEGKIKIFDSERDKIIMFQDCDIIVSDEPDTLREVLRECDWIIKKVYNEGYELNRLIGYEFSFEAEGIVTLSNGEYTSEGTWAITSDENYGLVMAITMGDEPGVSFEWPLRDLRKDRLKFGIPGTGYDLILERNCDNDDTDGDVTYIRELFMDSLWKAALFQMNDDPMPQAYGDEDFAFKNDGGVSVLNAHGDEIDYGRWRVYRNSENELEMIISFGSESNYYPLANDYKMVEIEDNRIELNHWNEEDGLDILVLEKKK